MSGYEIKNLDGVVTPKVRSIFLIDKTIIKEEDCINCGLCNMVCPMGCDPLLNYKWINVLNVVYVHTCVLVKER